jgi:hypothetical protein
MVTGVIIIRINKIMVINEARALDTFFNKNNLDKKLLILRYIGFIKVANI